MQLCLIHLCVEHVIISALQFIVVKVNNYLKTLIIDNVTYQNCNDICELISHDIFNKDEKR